MLIGIEGRKSNSCCSCLPALPPNALLKIINIISSRHFTHMDFDNNPAEVFEAFDHK